MKNWWYVHEGERFGPVQELALVSLRQKGTLTDESLCWRDGLSNWTPIGQVPELRKTSEVPPPLPNKAGTDALGCAGFIATEATAQRRFVARSIDVIWESIVVLLLCSVVLAYWRQLAGQPLQSVAYRLFDWGDWESVLRPIPLIISVLLVDSLTYLLFRNTPGKALLGILVRHRDGQVLTALRYLHRNGRMGVLSLGCGLFFIAFFAVIHQFGRISEGAGASHDEASGDRVLALPLSGRRIAIICLNIMALMVCAKVSYDGAAARVSQAVLGCQTVLERLQNDPSTRRREDDFVEHLILSGWPEQRARLALSNCAP